jgi:glucose-1-phosphate thymidylyltransferase
MSKNWKGIVLAGGSGSRLNPLTRSVSKQLLPIYDKPLIYYPISVLMLAEIKDILIISTPEDIGLYKRLLGDGSKLGVNFEYCVQKKPNGLAEAFILGKDFIQEDNVSLILGDNIFYGQDFSSKLTSAKNKINGATVFAYQVKDPNRFGVVEFDENNKAISIEEKPIEPKSNYALTGLYFYDNEVINYANSLKPSQRGELEITDINNIYLDTNSLNVEVLGRGFSWLDTGTHDSLLNAGQLISTIQKSQGSYVACLEEIALIKKWISPESMLNNIKDLDKTNYESYIKTLIKKLKNENT